MVVIGGRLDVDQDDVGAGAHGIVVGDAEGALFDDYAVDQLGQARLVALEGAEARIQMIDLPARALGATLHTRHCEFWYVGQQGSTGDAHIAHADHNDVGHDDLLSQSAVSRRA